MGLLEGYESIANKAIPQYANAVSSSTNWWDNLNKSVGFDGGLLGNASTFLDDNSKAIGTLGGLYSAYSTQDMAKKQYNLQKDAYNFNKMLAEREIENQDDAKSQFAYGFSNSNAKV